MISRQLNYNFVTIFFFLLTHFFSCQNRNELKQPLSDTNLKIEHFGVSPEAGKRLGASIKSPIELFANGTLVSRNEFPLTKGTYILALEAKGSQAYNIYPKIKIFLDDLLLEELQLTEEYLSFSITFRIEKEQYSILKIQFDSDDSDKNGNDRNVFIKSISLTENKNLKKNKISPDIDLKNEKFELPSNAARLVDNSVIYLFANGAITSKDRLLLQPGEYSLMLEAKGTKAYDVYPKIKVFLNDKKLDDVQLTKNYTTFSVPFLLPAEGQCSFKIEFNSDGLDANGNNRDVFIKSIVLKEGYSEENALTFTPLALQSFEVPATIGTNAEDLITILANGVIESNKNIVLKPGDYSLFLEARGTQAYQTFPSLKIFCNNEMVGEVELSDDFSVSIIPFHISEKQPYKIRIAFDSDGLDDKGNNRDVFIKSISLKEGRIEPNPIAFSDLALESFDVSAKIGRKTNDSIRLFSNGAMISKRKVAFRPGSYSLVLEARGTMAYKTYPTIRILLDNVYIGGAQLFGEYLQFSIAFIIPEEKQFTIKVEFDSDGLDQKGNDRDVFIRNIALREGYFETPLTNFGLVNFEVPLKSAKSLENSGIHLFANGAIASKNNLVLKKGKYTLILEAKGSQAYFHYPKVKVYVGNSLLKEAQLSPDYSLIAVPFKVKKDGSYQVKVVFDSDGSDEKGNDRDVFIKAISLKKGHVEYKAKARMVSALKMDDFVIPAKVGIRTDQFFRLSNNGAVTSKRDIDLEKGGYLLSIEAKGTMSYDVYPTIKILINGILLREIELSDNYSINIHSFDIWTPQSSIELRFDSDVMDPLGNDRDVFIRSITVTKN